jgi:hypothetical protein
MLATGSWVSYATAFRIGVGCLELWTERAPALMRTALEASLDGSGTSRAQATFRDDLLGLARVSAEISWREVRRGLADFDEFTRPDGPGERPSRPYRVKP